MKLAGALIHPTAAGVSQYQIASSSLMLEDVLDSKSNSVLKHLGEIADSVLEWEGAVAENLRLTPADIADIKIQYPKKIKLQALVTIPSHNNLYILQYYRREALKKWKQKLGSDATYGNLASAFREAGHADYADKIYDIIGKMLYGSQYSVLTYC